MAGRKHLLVLGVLIAMALYVIWVRTDYFENAEGHHSPHRFQPINRDLDLWRNNQLPKNSTEVKNKSCNFENYVVGQNIDQTDPCLLAFFRKKMLTPPRSPESLKTIAFDRKDVDVPSNIEKLKWAVALLVEGAPEGTQFFFVESGAVDGRYLSSTLRLETLYGWNGVLIEPLKEEFQELLKNRKVWAVNSALCVTPHTEYINYYSEGVNQPLTNQTSMNVKLPCVPLYTILAALNVTVVDYLSLDIEGAELQVLKTVPFDKITFKIMAIEYNHIPGDNQVGQLQDFLKRKGYMLVAINQMDRWTRDCMFVHNSVYREKYSMIKYLIKNQKLVNSVLLDDVRFKTKS